MNTDMIFSKPCTAKRFTLNWFGNPPDNLFELIGENSLSDIRKYTITESIRQNNITFEISSDEIWAFLGLCIISGVIKGRGEPLYSFWKRNTIEKYSVKQWLCFKIFCDVFNLITTQPNCNEELQINLKQLGSCVKGPCWIARRHSFLMSMWQLTVKFSVLLPGALLYSICLKSLQIKITFSMVCEAEVHYFVQTFSYNCKTDNARNLHQHHGTTVGTIHQN